jgi:hypothetical protein
MVQQNYLDVYPSTSIAKQLEKENLDNAPAIQALINDVNEYVKSVEQESVQMLHARKNRQITSKDTFKFFRSQERNRNTRLLLQYLVTFLNELPMEKDIDGKLVNPFDQLKSFSRFWLGLLKENDVTNAILSEHEKLGLLNETNAWYYRGQINKSYKQISDVLARAQKPIVEHYCLLFEALQRICLFWFSVRNENINRVRKSDVYLFKLSWILLNRYRSPDS